MTSHHSRDEVVEMLEGRRLKFASAAVCVGAALLATPSFSADANNGRRIAFRWCQPCHVVAETQTRPTGEAPPFAEIANRPDFDSARLALFLLDPHPKMPDMSLTRFEAGDLAAYVKTLAK
jgi:mono/diheme cytochrome c family protein